MNTSPVMMDLFAPEPAPAVQPAGAPAPPWKVMLVDDDGDIHRVLHLALQDMRVEGRSLQLLDARSAAEARALLAAHPDVGLILLDVVMESELAGLSFVRHVRREVCNHVVQIVLVTGQPGYAPQRDVVADYEIDGYRLKSELNADKIFVSVYVALRTYKALRDSEQQRSQLQALSRELGEKEERLRSVVDTAPDAIVQTDAEGCVVGWNEGAHRLFGYSAADMRGQPLARLLRLSKGDGAAAGGLPAIATTGPDALGHLIEMVAVHRDGSEFPVELALGMWNNPSGAHYSAVIRDVSERKRAEAGLRLAANVYANSYEGIVITDAAGIIIDVNPAFTRITGYPRDEAVGRTPHILSSGRHDVSFYQAMWASIHEHDFWQGEICNRRRDGEIYTEILSLSVIRDSKGDLQHYIGVFSDISLLKAHEEELFRIAHYDTLTDLPNRRLLSDRLAQALARSRRSGNAVAVCYLDLDGFKGVNDAFGHAVGDKLLVEIATRLNGILRTEDTLARLGGDEFVLLLTELAAAHECQFALDRVLRVIGASIVIEAHPIAVSASIGVTLYPADDVDADTLMRHADQAMYMAKQGGKNSYHFFDPVQDRQVQTQRYYMQRLREALEQQEFVLHYQPKADLVTGQVVGFEALIRWQHPQDGLLMPGAFLHYLEGSELEVLVGEWVLDTVLTQIGRWRATGLRLSVSANISADHLLRDNFADRLRDILARHPDVSPADLELEILETAALTDMKKAVQAITRCRKHGVQFALDDFGTGYASLTYFLNLPVQLLKIDQSFVRAMLDDPGGLGIVESVVRLAQAFNRPVIAEGVETLTHGAMLLHFGCRLAQGYGVGRPMPVDRVQPWMQEWHVAAPWRDLVVPSVDTDVTLQVAAQSQSRWVDRVALQIASGQEDAQVGADGDSCGFCRWYRGGGYASYGGFAEYKPLGAAHEQAHAQAVQALAFARAGRADDSRLSLQALAGSRDAQNALLEDLGRASNRSRAGVNPPRA